MKFGVWSVELICIIKANREKSTFMFAKLYNSSLQDFRHYAFCILHSASFCCFCLLIETAIYDVKPYDNNESANSVGKASLIFKR